MDSASHKGALRARIQTALREGALRTENERIESWIETALLTEAH
jgi:hypothetical protein